MARLGDSGYSICFKHKLEYCNALGCPHCAAENDVAAGRLSDGLDAYLGQSIIIEEISLYLAAKRVYPEVPALLRSMVKNMGGDE